MTTGNTPAPIDTLDVELDKILDDLDWGYTYAMSDYATSREQEKQMEKDGLEEIAQVKQDLKHLISQEVQKAEKNGVAWAIGVIDNMHFDVSSEVDREYKGIKNTLRDRYKGETGVDPAPSYPVNATLAASAEHPTPTTNQENKQ